MGLLSCNNDNILRKILELIEVYKNQNTGDIFQNKTDADLMICWLMKNTYGCNPIIKAYSKKLSSDGMSYVDRSSEDCSIYLDLYKDKLSPQSQTSPQSQLPTRPNVQKEVSIYSVIEKDSYMWELLEIDNKSIESETFYQFFNKNNLKSTLLKNLSGHLFLAGGRKYGTY